MNKPASLFLLLITLFALSCKKEYSFEGRPQQQEKNYFPLTINSNWAYLRENVPAQWGDSIKGLIGGQVVINNQTYIRYIFNYYNINIAYYRKSGSDYFEYIKEYDIERPFLKDNVPVNTTWSSPEYTTANMTKIKYEYTLKEKYVSFTVGSEVFTNVLKISVKVKNSINGSPYTTVAESDNYYADNIGLIKWIEHGYVVDPSQQYIYKIVKHQVF